MDGQERIIRRLFMEQHCLHCGSSYEPENVMVLARRSEVWMVMISCIDCTQKDTYVVKFPPQLQGRQRVTSYRLSKPPTTPMSEEPRQAFSDLPGALVTIDDVMNMHLFLKAFNGDFQGLFTETD